MIGRSSRSRISQTISRPATAGDWPARLLLWVLWFGLVTGLVEVSFRAMERFMLHRLIFVSPHIVWMTPLANLGLFALAGCMLFVAARRWPRFASQYVACSVLAFLSFLSVLFLYGSLHKFAALLLAAGLSVQTARYMVTHSHGFHTLVRRTTVWIVVLIGVLAVSVYGTQVLAEHRAQAKLPPASLGAPNMLLIVLDTVRAKSLSLYDYARPTTPYLEQWAKTGVRFEWALATAPWTVPSHASMFTGHFPHELSPDNWHTRRVPLLDHTSLTLAEALSMHGYRTAGFVANTQYCSYESGLNRGFAHYEDYVISPGQIMLSSSLGRTIANSPFLRRIIGFYDLLGRKTAEHVNRHFLQWLSRQDQRPFFAFLNYYDAHEPYLPPTPFDVKFGAKTHRKNDLIRYPWPWAGRVLKENMSRQEIQAELDAYEGSIASLDHHLGRLFEALRLRGVFRDTLVIVTSDHGEQFGEHGLFTHDNSLYLPVLHVPLLIAFPARVPEGRRIQEPVTLRDLPATVIDLLNLDDQTHFPGSSLARYWSDTRRPDHAVPSPLLSEVGLAARHPWYPTAKGTMRSLVVDRYHYIKNGDDREELYDVERDPLEEYDLSGSQEGRQVLTRFRTLLETMLVSRRSPREMSSIGVSRLVQPESP